MKKFKDKTAIIVEDQTIDALNASKLVEGLGMRVLGIAKSAEKVFSLLENEMPDLVLLDINLGGEETGIEIGQAITGSYGIPIIFTTSYSDDETIASALAVSPYGYLIKPYGRASLETAVHVAMERRRIEDDIRKTNSRFSMASSVAKLGVLEVDATSNSVIVNGVEELMNFPHSLSLESFYDLFPEKEIPKLKSAVHKKCNYRTMLQINADEDNTRWYEVVLSDVTMSEGRVQIGAIQDVSPMESVKSKLSIADKIISEIQEGVLVCDDAGIVLKANDAFCDMMEKAKEDVISQSAMSVFPSDRKDDPQPDMLTDGLRTEVTVVSDIGVRRHLVMSVTSLYQNSPKQFFVAIFTDITELKSSENQLKQLAYTDSLTGAGNRNYLNTIIDSYTSSNEPCAIVFIDIDEFKLINDSHGHEVGDEVLQSCVARLRTIVREEDKIIRFGGDEFIIVTSSILREELNGITKRLKTIFSEPFQTNMGNFRVTASLGVAVSSESMTAGELLKNADIAMYSAKRNGKNRVVNFDETLSKDIEHRLFIQQGLDNAIASKEISAYFQPIVDIHGNVLSLEALARWHVPDYGSVSPEKFIPIAELTQHIHEIGLHMLEEACIALRTLTSWGFDEIKVNINLSAVQLQKRGIVDAFKNVIDANNIDSSKIVLEITESTLQNSRARITLSKLKLLGFKVSIDDFGTGFSCISELADDIYDAIKIDRSLLPCFPLNDDGAKRRALIIENVISLCSSLNMPCTLEGLETSEQVSFARRIGATAMQGFHFAKPLSMFALMEYMQAHHATKSQAG